MERKEITKYNDLIARFISGDQSAFSAFYDMFSPQLFSFTLRKVQDAEVAKDIIHDLFLSLWKNRQHLNEIESIETYLYSSCRYLTLNYLRKSHIFDSYRRENPYLLEKTTDTNIEDQLHYRYLLDKIETEIENLPKKCQQVFKMSRKDNLSNKQIAQQLEIAESTVEKHINKAIKRLRIVTRGLMVFVISLFQF